VRKARLSVICFGVTVGLVFGLNISASGAESLPGSAEAEPLPEGYGNWTEVFAAQEILTKQANRIEDELTRAPNSRYSGVKIDLVKREVDVFWKGTLPSSARASLNSGAGRYPVVVTSSQYTRKELSSIAERLLSGAHQERLRLADGTSVSKEDVTFVSADEDGSGVTVGVRKESIPQERPSRSGESPDGLATLVSAEGGADDVRVTVEANSSPVKQQNTSRAVAPHYGGALYGTWNNAWCSTGFGVTQNGARYMLTARHCGETGRNVYNAQGVYIGRVTNANLAQDIAIFSIDSGAQPARIIHSGTSYNQNSGNGAAMNVTGFGNPAVGGFVYTNGAFVGQSGSGQVTSSSYYYNDPNGARIGPLYRAANTNNAVMSGSGNSGGPVYQYTSGGGVTAVGTISSGGDNVACPSGVLSNSCTSDVTFSGASRAAQTLNLSGF
jgi:hypothetical protein